MPPPRPAELGVQVEQPHQPPMPPARPADLDVGASAPPALQRAPDEAAVESASCAAVFADTNIVADAAPPLANGNGQGACGVREGVMLRGVRLADGSTIMLQSAVQIRCAMAAAAAQWIREDLAPSVASAGSPLVRLVGVGAYECRLRNNQSSGKISEHATGNAFDVHAVTLKDGRTLQLMGAEPALRTMREDIKRSACARFTTVLGSGSDGFHEDHLHIDLQARRNGYRICQWDVR